MNGLSRGGSGGCRTRTGWMEAIGRDPQALVRFFEKIAKECGEICDGGSMLASHPSFSERIEALSQ